MDGPVTYGKTSDCEAFSLYNAVRGAHQRLAAVVDNLPHEDEDGEAIPAIAVVEEVLTYLDCLADSLHSWANTKWPEVPVIPHVHERICRYLSNYHAQHERELERAGYDVQRLMRVLATVVLSREIATNPDLPGMIDAFEDLLTGGPNDLGYGPWSSGKPRRVAPVLDLVDPDNWPTVPIAPTLYRRMLERCRPFAKTGAIDARGMVVVLVNSAAQVPADLSNNDVDFAVELENFGLILRELRDEVDKSSSVAGQGDRTAEAAEATPIRKHSVASAPAEDKALDGDEGPVE